MAEFCEVIRQKDRMCKNIANCIHCKMGNKKNGKNMSCSALMNVYPDIAEHIILEWAAENPEPKYPTWVEWWNENFNGDGRRMFTPCSFVSPAELGCSIGHDGCMSAPYKCWHTPIPAHIAEKLGIRPVTQ